MFMEMIPSPQLGFLRGVFLANHLANNDDLTNTTKRQNTYQRKLRIPKRGPNKQQYNIKHAKIYDRLSVIYLSMLYKNHAKIHDRQMSLSVGHIS